VLFDIRTDEDEQPGQAAREHLTEREIDVLREVARGLTNKQIALALGISEHTVKFHVSSVYGKLGASNRTEAVRKGARRGFIPL
jgi:DNA-binding NarL/FixJ family response regulator